MNNPKDHVIVFPYPAQGHINPLLQFAKVLVSKGLKATLATTPYTIKHIHAPTVAVEAVSDGYDEGGFKHAHTWSSIARPEDHSASLVTIMEKFETLELNDWLFYNTWKVMKALEGLWPFIPVRPVIPSAYLDQPTSGDTSYGASLWKPTSENYMRWGLKASNKYFLWVLKESEDRLVEEDFLSGLEALSIGVPMVAVGLWSDQPTNAKLIEELWGVGSRAEKDSDGILTGKELDKCIRDVMDGEKSEDIKMNASKWGESAAISASLGGSSEKNISEFSEFTKILMTGMGKYD
ncbi:UDP-glucuronosyl/UDP-glucosyltransferase [Sesbania bispinosa]|nr:UDP-glucuronosyl/UDP-glucosyltransferase [Sesbania bispinosa]